MTRTATVPADAIPEPLQSIRNELTALRARIGPLEQAEALLAPIYAPGKPQKAHRTRRKKPAAARPKRNPSRAEILDYLLTHGPAARKELLSALGGRPKTMSNNLKRLLEDGDIEADVAPGGRLYRAPSSVEHSSLAALSTLPPPPETYLVLDAIDALGKATTEQLMARTGLAKPVVVAEGQQLRRLGLVELAGGAGGKPVWVRAADPDRAAA